MATLFDCLARNTDPATSYRAAANHAAIAKTHRQIVWRGLQRHPGKTAAELAYILDMDYHECMRRLGDLKRFGFAQHGKARECLRQHTRCVEWLPRKEAL